jgi:hypothetical protein
MKILSWLFPDPRVDYDAAIARAVAAETLCRAAHRRERALWDANRQLEDALQREKIAREFSDTLVEALLQPDEPEKKPAVETVVLVTVPPDAAAALAWGH